ncbi:DUF4186 family protein [Pedobacter sp. CFBP9032]|uniref:DUF4186 family protein n=1 Tax=Pedobacter sp. CFBP9032 TaxID=3096539 RepID=UPI002A6B8CC8|nr:DUF4186 family protein [Pedobacter sp. CFBP9032]MDY0903799.1 DUF4186 family protein [Pedobacter sp. CFBP9032]
MNKRKKFLRVVPEDINVDDLKIEDIVCGTTKCEDGFHCYSQKKSTIRKHGKERVCRECGVDLIDWERVHKNDINDSNFTFQQLETEIIRHVFWHTPMENEAILDALKKGKAGVRTHAHKLITQRIGKYNSFMDGRQTPMGEEIIVNYAQHATATCCRKCLEAWHNIPMEENLTDAQKEFCVSLVMKYVEERVPQISDESLSEDEAVKILENEYN